MLVMKQGKEMHASSSSSFAVAPPFMNMSPHEVVYHLTSSNAVVIFSSTDCCMSTVAKRLLFSLGVGPTIVELDQHDSGNAVHAFLQKLASGTCQPLPAIFVGGRFLGRVETLLATHIDGSLIPILKDAGALWL